MSSFEGIAIFASLAIIIVGSIFGMFAFHKDFSFNGKRPVVYVEKSTVNDEGLAIEVKGSIYESGEEMTLYGACFNHLGALIPSANMTLSAWYPDGTLWINETAMTPTGDGKFSYKLNMSSTQGTYLTQATCNYGSKTAVTIGEWQNPVWVGRIKNTQDYLVLINQSLYLVSSQIANLTDITINATDELLLAIADVKDDTDDILTYLGMLNTSISITGADNYRFINEVYNLVHAMAPNCWVIDEKASYFNENSTVVFNGVSMAHETIVHAVAEDGLWASYDGTSWNSTYLTGYSWNAVDAVPAEADYAWAVGYNSTAPVFSVNKVYFSSINSSNATEFTDVNLHYVNGSINTYIAADNGELWHYDGLSVFTLEASLAGSGPMRLSLLDDDTLFLVRGEYLHWKDGGSYSSLQIVGEQFADVGVAYPDLAYAVSHSNVTGEMNFYKYNGVNWTIDLIDGGGYTPTSLSVLNSQDIWVATESATIFFHYDGFDWELVSSPYTDIYGNVVISFSNLTFTHLGINDMSMLNPKQGYAVGEAGIIVKFCNVIQNTYETVQEINTNVELLVNRSSGIKAWVQN